MITIDENALNKSSSVYSPNSDFAYIQSSLSSLKSKLYQILGKIYETNQPVSITDEEIQDFLNDLDTIDSYIKKMNQ